MYHYLLVYIMTCAFTLHSMERKSLSSFFQSAIQKITSMSSLAKNQDEYVYEKIQRIRDEKTALENKLKLDWLTVFQKEYIIPVTLQLFMKDDGLTFLKYIYYEKFQSWDEDFSPFKELESDSVLTGKCLDYQLDGYSALGVSVICQTVLNSSGYDGPPLQGLAPSSWCIPNQIDLKKKQIARLINLGFKPTKKDLELSYLELYDRTKEDSYRKFLLLFLTERYQNKRNSMLPSLSLDIIKKIAWYVTSDEEPLLKAIE